MKVKVQRPASEAQNPLEVEGTSKPGPAIGKIKLWDFRRGPIAPKFDILGREIGGRHNTKIFGSKGTSVSKMDRSRECTICQYGVIRGQVQ